jgi:hypothetical protein
MRREARGRMIRISTDAGGGHSSDPVTLDLRHFPDSEFRYTLRLNSGLVVMLPIDECVAKGEQEYLGA